MKPLPSTLAALAQEERHREKREKKQHGTNLHEFVATFYRRSDGQAIPLLSLKRLFARYLNDHVLELAYLQGRRVDDLILKMGFPIGPTYRRVSHSFDGQSGSVIYVGNMGGWDNVRLADRRLVLEDNCLLPCDLDEVTQKKLASMKFPPSTIMANCIKPLASPPHGYRSKNDLI